MGMGEPLANYDAVIKALRNLIEPDGMNFSHRKVTLSTCGLVPEIKGWAAILPSTWRFP
jgi:23S rRNA (adenine2503-C2)-methyltransferase